MRFGYNKMPLESGHGEMAEWSNAADSKSVIGLALSGVRIPLSPPGKCYRVRFLIKIKEELRRSRILTAIVAIIAILGPEISAKTPNKYMITAAIIPLTASMIDCMVAR